MKGEYLPALQNDFSPESRVWIYQSNRAFTRNETEEVRKKLDDFIVKWKSHGTPVKGAAFLFFDQFIVLMADEKATGVSGCSTDSSVRLIKDIESGTGAQLFERTTLAFVIDESVQLIPLSQLQEAFDAGRINSETYYFNNLVETKDELEKKWIVPIRESWLNAKILSSKAEVAHLVERQLPKL